MCQPELGRFMQPDPKHFAAGDYNLYRYAHNDAQVAAAVTTAESSTSGNSITWHIKVEYNQKDFGPRWMAFARAKEHEHADWILDYAQSRATTIAATNAFQQGRLESAAQNLLYNKMAHEEFLDKFTGRHTLKDNGQAVPQNE